uniref:Uncharacterized protein n=1 Tax=Vespula pensylvanica TaxID=30213 RepID=A0A834P4T1_VESPE|nr:hypothetical protein H0235_005511 [Vespula pensylvanica]
MFPKRSQCEEVDLYRDHSGEMKADRSRDLYLERCSYKKERLRWDLLGKAGVDFAFSSLLFLFACVPSASTVKEGRQVDVPTVFQSSREYEAAEPSLLLGSNISRRFHPAGREGSFSRGVFTTMEPFTQPLAPSQHPYIIIHSGKKLGAPLQCTLEGSLMFPSAE